MSQSVLSFGGPSPILKRGGPKETNFTMAPMDTFSVFTLILGVLPTQIGEIVGMCYVLMYIATC